MTVLEHRLAIGMAIVAALCTSAGAARAADPGIGLVPPQAESALIVQRDDLPVAFAIAGGDYQPDGAYVAMYFRPEVLAAKDLPDGDLLGILARLEVLPDVAAAKRRFAEKTTAQDVREDMRRSRGQEPSRVQFLTSSVEGADETLVFRVDYELEGVGVVEYRYRLRIANAVASLMIDARAGDGGAEPPAFAARAEEIAARQSARLARSVR